METDDGAEVETNLKKRYDWVCFSFQNYTRNTELKVAVCGGWDFSERKQNVLYQ